MPELTLAYVRHSPAGPELCLQRTTGDDLEVYNLTDGQSANIMIRLATYLWSKSGAKVI